VEDDDIDNEDMEFTSGEFVEAIVRVTDRRFCHSKGLTLAQRVKKGLSEYILTNACRSNTDHLRAQLNKSECKVVFNRYRHALEQIYRRYSVSSKAISVAGFSSLMQVCLYKSTKTR